jgi:uncharacterized protein
MNSPPLVFSVAQSGKERQDSPSPTFWHALAAFAAGSGDVVISQIDGGGGNKGATYKFDFVEFYNRGNAAIDLTRWHIQCASATGTSWQITALKGFVAPGR